MLGGRQTILSSKKKIAKRIHHILRPDELFQNLNPEFEKVHYSWRNSLPNIQGRFGIPSSEFLCVVDQKSFPVIFCGSPRNVKYTSF